MREVRGKEVTAAMKEQMVAELEKLDFMPQLAIIRVGEKPDDMAYERGAVKRMDLIGLRCKTYHFDGDISHEEFVQEFQKINEDPDVDGILLLRPLPKQINERSIEYMIDPAKDVDCISPLSMSMLFMGDDRGFAPCTAEACVETLLHIGEPLAGKRAAVIGRSLVVGKPLAMLLLKQNCTVTMCHSKTADIPETCRECDIVIACAGRAKLVDASYIKEGAVLLDVGINVDEDGKMCGDVDYESIQEKAGIATPVPGGIGAVTTSVLAKHVIRAAIQRRG